LTIPGIPKRRNLVWALSFSWVLILTRYISYSSSSLGGEMKTSGLSGEGI
jgi:hypothetical protein